MLKKCTWLFCFMAKMVVDAGSSEILRDASFRAGVRAPRTQWSYYPQEDFYRHRPQGISHGYPQESTLGATENSAEYPGYSSSTQEYWKLGSVNPNSTGYNHNGYSGSHLGSADGTSYQDSKLVQGSHSLYHYQQTRPVAASRVTVKKAPGYYLKGNLQVHSFDAAGKSKYKKTTLHQTGSGHKSAYPRVHKPYAKHKYPIRKIVQPPHRNYYQSPYQRYALSTAEMLRYKLRAPGEGYYKASTAPPSPASFTQRYHTTERMDDAYPEGSSASEDYSTYNDTHQGSNGGYYEAYEEIEKTTSVPEESLYDENTTRGYYGDRIYMSTQVPLATSPDRAVPKNKYFVVRRTSNDEEDIETIFE